MNNRIVIFTIILSATLVAITVAFRMGSEPENTTAGPMAARHASRRDKAPCDIAATTQTVIPAVHENANLSTAPVSGAAAATGAPHPVRAFSKRWNDAGEQMRRAGLDHSAQLNQYGELLSAVSDDRFVTEVKPLIVTAVVYDAATEALYLDLSQRNLPDALPVWAEICSQRKHPLYGEAERYLRFHLGGRYSPDPARTRRVVEQMFAGMSQP